MKIPEELYNYIISGKCVLFLGAGASMEAGAPSAQQIARELSKKYLQGQHGEEPPSKVAAYIEAKPGLGKTIPVNYLINRLSHLTPSEAHFLIPKFNWAAVYTTNYDTLVEQAYEQITEGRIKCKPLILSSDLTVNMSENSVNMSENSNCVYIYKPHGCITRPSSMVVTEGDYYSASDKRKAIYRQLEVHKYRSVFLFIGYSFSDFNLSKIWFDVLKEMGKFSQWAYALWPNHSEVQMLTWQAKKVELIDMRFGEFMTELSSIPLEEGREREFSISDTAIAEVVKALVAIINAKDPTVMEHGPRIQKLALMISEEMGIPIYERQLIETAALLRDIGSIAVPDSILRKTSALSSSEWEILKGRPIVGEQLLSSIPGLKNIAKIVRSLHERFDGKGYPDGLTGEHIPQLARIIVVASCLDALMSKRWYRPVFDLKEAIVEIKKNSDTEFDPTVVSALKRLYSQNKLVGLR